MCFTEDDCWQYHFVYQLIGFGIIQIYLKLDGVYFTDDAWKLLIFPNSSLSIQTIQTKETSPKFSQWIYIDKI
jgi:hypothetical protein